MVNRKVLLLLALITFFSNPVFAEDIYDNYIQPIEGMATGNAVKYTNQKVCSSLAYSILGLITVGDAGIQKAMDAGDINRVQSVETSVKHFILFSVYVTDVYGEKVKYADKM